MVRFNALMPRRAMESISRLLKGDQVLTHPDHTARAAYEARMVETIAVAETPTAELSAGQGPAERETEVV